MDCYRIMRAWRNMQEAVDQYDKVTEHPWSPAAEDASDELRKAFREFAELVKEETSADAGEGR